MKLFCFSRQKAETFSICLKLSFMKPQTIITFIFFIGSLIELEFCKVSRHSFSSRCWKFSAFCLEKQKRFIPKKHFSSHCQYQNKKATTTYPIFNEGFGHAVTNLEQSQLLGNLAIHGQPFHAWFHLQRLWDLKALRKSPKDPYLQSLHVRVVKLKMSTYIKARVRIDWFGFRDCIAHMEIPKRPVN